MPNEAATQHRPADAPAAMAGPRPNSRPRNIANTNAAIRLSRNDRPNIMAKLPLAACSSGSPAARFHGLAHSRTAIQFTSGMEPLPYLSGFLSFSVQLIGPLSNRWRSISSDALLPPLKNASTALPGPSFA